MKTNHETGARVIIAVRENMDFARSAVEWLLSKQDDEERMQGTSLHRNGEGLSKTHATQIDMKSPSKMSHGELTAIASAYTHTQLAEAVETQELVLPKRNKRRRRNNQILEEDDEPQPEDEEQQQEDEAREQPEEDERVDKNYRGPVHMPSRALCARVATIVKRLRAKDVKNEMINEGTWTPADVKNAIIEESQWMLGYVDIEDSVVDAALYYTLPALIFSPGNPPRGLIRIWWYSESVWASAIVDRVSVTKGELRVDLTFPDESASGFVTGTDVLSAYEMV
jgi:flagellar motor protein MotB